MIVRRRSRRVSPRRGDRVPSVFRVAERLINYDIYEAHGGLEFTEYG